MKKILITAIIIFNVLIFPSTALAEIQSTGWTGHGLYLIQGNNMNLNKVNINISINNDQTASIDAEYEVENTTDQTINAYFGVPEHEVELKNFKSWVSPYEYYSKKVSGDSINEQIQGLDKDYNNWRTWPSPFKPGEKRLVRYTYQVDNKLVSDSKYLISYQMDHINFWQGNPDVNVIVNFDNNEVKIYNFGNEFSIKPELEEDFTLKWSFDTIENDASIDFDYYSVDYEILSFLDANSSNRINKIVSAYKSKDYTNVIQLGKEYIQNPEDEKLQKEIYFLMADAYLQEDQPEESLIIYKLVEEETIFYEGIQEKLQHLITYNRIKCFFKTEDYKTLYRILSEVKEDNSYSFIYQDWAESQIDKIPQEVIDEVIEEDRVPEGFEKLKLEFINGEYNTIILIAGGVIFVAYTIIHSIIRKKKGKKFLFRK